jgi:hypothetical protein
MAKAELEVKPGAPRDLLNEIRNLIEDARRQTAAAVNVGLTALYWPHGLTIFATEGWVVASSKMLPEDWNYFGR